MKTLFRKRIIVHAASLLAPFLIATASSAAGPTPGTPAGQMREVTDTNSTVLTFKAANAELTGGHKSQLKTLSESYKRDPQIEEIVVAAYSDKPYRRDQELAKEDRDLAERRGKLVKDAMSKLIDKRVRIVNMAEKNDWYELAAKEAESTIEEPQPRGAQPGAQPGALPETQAPKRERSSEDKFNHSLGQFLQRAGGPGKVIVAARYAAEAVSH